MRGSHSAPGRLARSPGPAAAMAFRSPRPKRTMVPRSNTRRMLPACAGVVPLVEESHAGAKRKDPRRLCLGGSFVPQIFLRAAGGLTRCLLRRWAATGRGGRLRLNRLRPGLAAGGCGAWRGRSGRRSAMGLTCLRRRWLLHLTASRRERATGLSRSGGRLLSESRPPLLRRRLPWSTHLSRTVHGLLLGRHGAWMSWSSHRSWAAHGLLLRRRWGARTSWCHRSRAAHGLLLRRRSKATMGLGWGGRRVPEATALRRGPAPILPRCSVLVRTDVLPMSFVVVPITTPVIPAAIDDDVGGLDIDVARRRVLPVARHPLPLVAAPVPVATNPIVVRAWCHGDVLLLRRRWRARNEDRRLFFHNHCGLGLVFGRRRLVVDRLGFGRRWSHGDRGANHAACQSQARNRKGKKPRCGSGHVYLSWIGRTRLDLYSPDRNCSRERRQALPDGAPPWELARTLPGFLRSVTGATENARAPSWRPRWRNAQSPSDPHPRIARRALPRRRTGRGKLSRRRATQARPRPRHLARCHRRSGG